LDQHKPSSYYEADTPHVQPQIKTKVVLEALCDRFSLTELAQKHELHPTQIAQWKREFLDKASELFSKG